MQDQTLINSAIGGDAQAIEKILDFFSKKIFALCFRMAGNKEDAMDFAQESLIKIYRNFSQFKNNSSLSTWIYRVTSNVCIDQLRKRRMKVQSLDEMHEFAVYIPSDERSVEQQVLDNLDREDLEKAINKLSEEHRLIIILREINGLSYEDIAYIIDCNLNTVKSKIYRSRLALRKILTETET